MASFEEPMCSALLRELGVDLDIPEQGGVVVDHPDVDIDLSI